MHRKLAPLLLGSAAALFASCLADVRDEPVADTAQPGIHPGGGSAIVSPMSNDVVGDARRWLHTHSGACTEACFDVWARICGDADVCSAADAQPDDVVTCADATLTCLDVRRAEHGEVAGLEECRTSCVAGQ
jgi:hypothetical protein